MRCTSTSMETRPPLPIILDLKSRIDMPNSGDGPTATFRRRPFRSITLKFEDVVYEIIAKSKFPTITIRRSTATNDNVKKKILKGVSGQVSPGEMLVMLGPSGSGKTTLLTALGGRLGGNNLTGAITYNNKPISNSVKRKTGFVTQDDILYPHLTVFETLYYTALLRLPDSLTIDEKVDQVNLVLDQLGLTTCRDRIIGGALIRGVSGGERKRVSIGQEMLVNPSLLFLDEPTSGLDSTTAQRIVSTLSDLTIAGGRTVVMTIHQPSSRLFYMFHKILLLSDGFPIYFGKGSDCIDYFAGIGFSPEIAMNPSDFLLDLSNGKVCDNGEEEEDIEKVKHKLVSEYTMNIHPTMRHRFIEEADQRNDLEEDKTGRDDRVWCTSWWTQFQVLLKRDIKERKFEAFSSVKVIEIVVISFLSSVLWWQSQTRVEDQIGLLFFITTFWGFFPLFESIFTFPPKRAMLAKERSSGMYRLSSYFVSRMVGDLPMDLTLPTLFLGIVYWTSGLKLSGATFIETLLVLLLTVLIVSGLGLVLGALFMDVKTAATIGAVTMLTSMLVGGFYIRNVPTFISWIKYMFVGYHSFKLFIAVQFSNTDTYVCDGNIGGCLVRDISAVEIVGVDSGIWWSILVMFCMLVVYRLTTYFALMRVGKVNN